MFDFAGIKVMGGVGGMTLNANVTSYGIAGPFPGYGMLAGVGYVAGGGDVTPRAFRLSFGIVFSGRTDPDNWRTSQPVFGHGATTIVGKTAVHMHIGDNMPQMVPFIPLFIPVRVGAWYLMAAVFSAVSQNARFFFWAVAAGSREPGDGNRSRSSNIVQP